MDLRPVHALLMTKASQEAAKALRPHERPHMISRAGPIGIARYGETWTGDNETSWHTLKWNLRQGLSMGLTGMAMTGHDIGGFSGPVPRPDLLIRWFQIMALHPRAVMNSWKPDLPFMYDEATGAVRAALDLRMQFLPLLYTLAHQAHRTGDPIIRPLLYEFPEAVDESEQDAFLLGANVLVAPVVEEHAEHVTLHLPGEGFDWIDFHTQHLYPAGTTASIRAPLDTLPILVRANSVLPMARSWDFAAPHEATALEFRTFAKSKSGSANVEVFWDDGVQPLTHNPSPHWHCATVT